MEVLIPLLIQILPFVILFWVGLLIGSYKEKQHFRSIVEREKYFSRFIVDNAKSLPPEAVCDKTPMFVAANVTIASDYFKTFASALKNIFGGEVRSLETLLERARREALLRVMEQARKQGFNAICNLKMDTADIGGNTSSQNKRKKAPMATIIASATAYKLPE